MPPAAKKKTAVARIIPLANLDELAAIWSIDARLPTVESRKAWCAARNLDYGHVNRQFWWKKSAKMKANKENVKGPRGGCYALPVGTPPVIDVKQEEDEQEEMPVKIEIRSLPPSSPPIPSSDTLCPSSPSIPSSDTLCPSSPPFVLKEEPMPVALEEIPIPIPPRKRVQKGPARKRVGPGKKANANVKKESIAIQDVLCGPIVEEIPARAPAPKKRKPVVKKSAPARKRLRFDAPLSLALEDLTLAHYCDGSCDLCSLPLPNPNEIATDTTRLEALYPWYFQSTHEPVFKTLPSNIPKTLWSLSAIAYESIT